MNIDQLNEIAHTLRIDIIRMVGEAGSGHPGGSLSCADIMAALYFGGILEHNPEDPDGPRDRFILAKGHAAPALYAVLAEAGYFPREELLTLRKLGSRLQGHPDCMIVPGVEMSTGSLGQGLSVACGLAAGLRLDGDEHGVFALLGDGECQEGQVWEAAMFAAHNKLDNLVAIVDRNCLQIDGNTKEICDPGDLAQKFAAFGWEVCDIDGHNMQEVVDVLGSVKADRSGKPHAIIAHTVKGKGVSFMENNVSWHGKAPKGDELVTALADLGYDGPVSCDLQPLEPVRFSRNSMVLISNDPVEVKFATPEQAALMKATRAGYGETLVKLADEGIPIVAVDADLSSSTTTKKLADAKPEYANRLFNVGIAEQNMVDVAAGLSLAGNVAFTASFAVFGTGRAYDQIRNSVCYANLNVKIAPTHAGISVGADGGSHQMIEDISLMRTLPNMRVLVPADYAAAAAAVRIAATTPGPVYVRLGREPVPCVYSDEMKFELGRAYKIREGSDATVVACGVEVKEALEAADKLAEEGIPIEVIDAFCIKPLDVKTITESVRKTGAVVTAEEHSILGGLGSAVAETLSRTVPAPIEFVGVKDVFGKSGAYKELAAFFETDAAAIVEAVKRVIARRQEC